MKELKHQQEVQTEIFIDNKSAIPLAKNLVAHGRRKHIEIRYHFIRYHVKEKTVKLTYCKTEDQIADIFTKPLKTETYSKLKKKLGLVSNEIVAEGECWKSSTIFLEHSRDSRNSGQISH